MAKKSNIFLDELSTTLDDIPIDISQQVNHKK